jgi:spermidine/putrescine transport system permease protein
MSIDDVIISYFTSGPGSQTLPIVVYNMTKRRITPDVYALSSIIILIVLAISIISQIDFKKLKKTKQTEEF